MTAAGLRRLTGINIGIIVVAIAVTVFNVVWAISLGTIAACWP